MNDIVLTYSPISRRFAMSKNHLPRPLSLPFFAAFTLLEIVIVTAIIAGLVTLITAAAITVKSSVTHSTLVSKMSQIESALERYKNEFGEYPPDMTRDAELIRHVKMRWPRYDFPIDPDPLRPARFLRQAIAFAYLGAGYGNVDFGPNDLMIGISPSNLALWLGGIPDQDGKCAGFGVDPMAPFGRDHVTKRINCGVVGGSDGVVPPNVRLDKQDRKVFLDLEVDKDVVFHRFYKDGSGRIPYFVVQSEGRTVPLIYFRAQKGEPSKAYHKFSGASGHHPSASGFEMHGEEDWRPLAFSVAYAKKGNGIMAQNVEWFEPNRYQLILPGKDGKFGNDNPALAQRKFRVVGDSFTGMCQEDWDNLTNFSGYKPLKTLLP